MIIGTAGHIDHGKTSLVAALTGIETDRLPEEKRRGMSIDLGFAHSVGPDGQRWSFVDVPGHDRYIRNMIAGIQGVDAALLVVAADDGPMPQTIEHTAILSLLGIGRVVVALNKIDRIDETARQGRIGDLRQWLAEGPLAGASIVPVSAVTGDGLPALRAALAAVAAGCQASVERARAARRRFRMPIDRVFSLPGEGLVVTGTVLDGSVSIGDRMAIGPRDDQILLRVRNLRVAGEKAQHAAAGVRLAANLTGPGARVDRLQRGDWLLAPSLNHPGHTIDAWVNSLPGVTLPARGLGCHLHAGTAYRFVRLSPLGPDLWRLKLDAPVLAQIGDRWLLRSADATRTLGVAVVADPCPASTRLRGAARTRLLGSIRGLSADESLLKLARELPEGVDANAFDAATGVDLASAALPEGLLRIDWRGGARVVDAQRVVDAIARIESVVTSVHRDHPSRAGPRWREICDALEPVDRLVISGIALDRAIAAGRLERCGGSIRRPGHRPVLEPAEALAWQQIEGLIEDERGRARSVHEIAEATGETPGTLTAVLERAAQAGLVHRVSTTRFLSPGRLAVLARIAEGLAREGRLAPAAFNAASGIGRNLSIELLEWFDSIRLTRRCGPQRLLTGSPDTFFPRSTGDDNPDVTGRQQAQAAGGSTFAETAVAGTAKSPPPR
jgi:selenocysteine-specific elongation factor